MDSRTRETATRHADAVRKLLQELAKHNRYFSQKTVAERDILRKLCLRNRAEYGMTLTEARQLLREEGNYQNWREMNDGLANASTRLSEDAEQ